MDKIPRYVSFSRLYVFACFCTAVSYHIAYDHGYSFSAKYSSPLPGYANHLWTILQAFLMCVPGLATGAVLARRHPAGAVWVGRILMCLFIVIHVLDLVAFTYYHDRLFSRTSAKIAFDLSPSLAWTLNRGIVGSTVAYCTVAILMVAVLWRLSDIISAWILRSRYCATPRQTFGLTCIAMTIFSMQPCLHFKDTIAWMKRTSDHQPIFALGFFQELSTCPKRPVGREILSSSLAAIALAPELLERESLYQSSSAQLIPKNLPDILIVVVESLRHEAITAETSPNIFKLASEGIWAKNHFSSGNSTNVSMFSVLYGLDSIWYERRRNEVPALIRTAKQCGYETGFYGGSTGWAEYKMDGFISPKNFDNFEISEVNWTKSDAHMSQAAQRFLDRKDTASKTPAFAPSKDETRKPRLAVLYLYSSHFDYHSDEVDQIHSPSIEGQLSLGYKVSDRDQVWNRYLNSVHCVDRLIGPLLTTDRLVCVVGDHGEAFLEDDCRLHATRISKYQNMTPCVIAGPGLEPKKLERITVHTDLVPTIFDAIGVKMKPNACWEGVSLLEMAQETNRTIVTRDYLSPEIALVDEEQFKRSPVFGHRCFFSLETWTCFPGSAIDERGVIIDQASIDGTTLQAQSRETLKNWIAQRFPVAASESHLSEVAQLHEQLQSEIPQVSARATEILAYLSSSEIEQLKELSIRSPSADTDDRGLRTAGTTRLVR